MPSIEKSHSCAFTRRFEAHSGLWWQRIQLWGSVQRLSVDTVGVVCSSYELFLRPLLTQMCHWYNKSYKWKSLMPYIHCSGNINALYVVRLEVWPGYVTAVDEYEDGIQLCCDCSHRVLRTQTVHQLMWVVMKMWVEERVQLLHVAMSHSPVLSAGRRSCARAPTTTSMWCINLLLEPRSWHDTITEHIELMILTGISHPIPHLPHTRVKW